MSKIVKRTETMSPIPQAGQTEIQDGDNNVVHLSWFRNETVESQIARYRANINSFIMAMGISPTDGAIQYWTDTFQYGSDDHEDYTHDTITEATLFFFMKMCSLIKEIISHDLSKFQDVCLEKCMQPSNIYDVLATEYEMPEVISESELWELFSEYYSFDSCLNEPIRSSFRKLFDLNRMFRLSTEQYTRDQNQYVYSLKFANFFDFDSFCSLLGLILNQSLEKHLDK